MKKALWVLIVAFLSIIVVGCGNKDTKQKDSKKMTAKEVFQEANKAHDNIKSVKVDFTEKDIKANQQAIRGTQKFDFDKERVHIHINTKDVDFLLDSDELQINSNDPSLKNDEKFKESYSAELSRQVEIQKNYFAFLEKMNENIYKDFELQEKKSHYILKYNGNEEKKLELITAMSDNYYEHMIKQLDTDITHSIDSVEDVVIEIVIDKKTMLMKDLTQNLVYTQKVFETENAIGLESLFEYSRYNKTKVKDKLTQQNATNDINTESDQNAEEAAQYLDALIQATVFQNVNNYVSKDPNPVSKSEKIEQANLQKDSFIGFYLNNTKNNLKQTNSIVSDVELQKLADAFLGALSHTKYKILNSRAENDTTYIVTLEVEGFNDMEIQTKASAPLIDEYEAGQITLEQVGQQSITLLTEAYNKGVTLQPPVTVNVNVTKNNGQYTVLLQDQYLLSFAQLQ